MVRYKGKNTRFSQDRQKKVERQSFSILRNSVSMFKKIFLHSGNKIKKQQKTKKTISRSHLKKFSIRSISPPDIIKNIQGIIEKIIKKIYLSKPLLIGIIAGLIISFLIILIMDFYRVKGLANFEPSVTTKIYDKNGKLISELFTHKRDIVPLNKIPSNIIHAFISIEDNEFYDHYGVNPKGIVRAFFINLFAGRIRQGGSTITQQLAKILLTSGKRSIYRKIKEAFIAIMMEFTYSKQEIMGLYLNQIFLGHGAYGIQTASHLYFNKDVWDLNLAECSLLATLPSAPNKLSPLRHPKRSMKRHKIVLEKMVEMGFITVNEAEKAYLNFWPSYLIHVSEVSPTLTTISSRVNRAPWFTEYIRRKLVKKYGKEMVYNKGLNVYTTLDLKKQIEAQNVLKSHLKRQTAISSRLLFKNDDYIIDRFNDIVSLFSYLNDIPPYRKKGSRQNEKINEYFRNTLAEELEGLNYLAGIESIDTFFNDYKKTYLEDRNLQKVEGCIISIDQRTGYIEALVGGSEFSSINQLNRAMQAYRQPGSAIKPLIYSAAIESKIFTPATAVLDSPIVYLDNEGGDWLPENYEGQFYGLVRLRKALMLSINVISIRIADQLGIGYVMKYIAKLLKFNPKTAKKRIPRNLSIALGSLEVSPFELTRAYSIIANGGKDVIPFSIRYIKDRDGKILENREKEVKKLLADETKHKTLQIIKPSTAQIMISMMKSVISAGTGQGASPGRPAAGKTGTTNNWKDAWFVGYTPRLTTGIWVGYDKMGLSLGIGQAGGGVAAPIWGEYMRKALKDEPVIDFPVYAKLTSATVCDRSGLLPSSNCVKTVDEIFVPGTEPTKTCKLCAGIIHQIDTSNKGPRDNISKEEKHSIIKNLYKDKKRHNNAVDLLNDDLLP